MADNKGQFGSEERDTEEMARRGGEASGASGAAGDTKAAKKGGKHSRRSNGR